MNARYAIVGTGLIGASVGLALRRDQLRRSPTTVVGWDPNKKASGLARRRGALDRVAPTLRAACADAGIVVLAAPLRAVPRLVARVAALVRPGALIVDVAGVKAPVARAMANAATRRPDVLFASGHPLAGNAGRGAGAARAALFDGAHFALVVPNQARAARARRAALAFARVLRAIPVVIDARAHDAAVAATSALPQLVSSALAIAVVRTARDAGLRLSGPGLDDATRLAASSHAQWRDGIAANRIRILRAVRAFETSFRSIASAVRRGDAGDRRLAALFAAAAAARTRIERRSGARRPAKRRK